MGAPNQKQLNIIAKNRNNQNNPDKRRKLFSYFDKQEQQYGSMWLLQKNPANFRLECKQIIRDLARQNIDLEKHSHYFNELIIINSLINECTQFSEKYNVLNNALEYYNYNMAIQNIPISPEFISVMSEYRSLLIFYSHMLVTFRNIFLTKNTNDLLQELYNFISGTNGKFYIEDDTITQIYQNEIEDKWKKYNEAQTNAFNEFLEQKTGIQTQTNQQIVQNNTERWIY